MEQCQIQTIQSNIDNVYSLLFSYYNDTTKNYNKRILLEQTWVLKKIVGENTSEVSVSLKNKIYSLYDSLKKEVF